MPSRCLQLTACLHAFAYRAPENVIRTGGGEHEKLRTTRKPEAAGWTGRFKGLTSRAKLKQKDRQLGGAPHEPPVYLSEDAQGGDAGGTQADLAGKEPKNKTRF